MAEALSTINYFQFKRIKSNRPIEKQHVTELVNEIRKENLLHLFPILVNNAMEIIDGQHRLAEAEQLGLYIYYQIDDKISKEHIARVNRFARNWKVNDYINYFTEEGADGFDKLSAFMLDNPLLPPSTVLTLFSKDLYSRDINGLKAGKIDTTNHAKAIEIALVLKYYAGLIGHAYERNFILAVIKCFQTPGYDHAEMQRQLESQSRSLVRCINVRQYVELFEEIYNRSKSKNTLRLKK